MSQAWAHEKRYFWVDNLYGLIPWQIMLRPSLRLSINLRTTLGWVRWLWPRQNVHRFHWLPPGHPIMGHKAHITEFTENKQILLHTRARKKISKKKRGTQQKFAGTRNSVGPCLLAELLLLSPVRASDSFGSCPATAAVFWPAATGRGQARPGWPAQLVSSPGSCQVTQGTAAKSSQARYRVGEKQYEDWL